MNQQEERLIPEAELMKTLGLLRPDLDRLRRTKKFPFVKFSSKGRAYFLTDVLTWAKEHRVVLDRDSE